MAKISARGDTAAIKLRKPNGGLVVITQRGRLLAQRIKGSGYTIVDASYGKRWAPYWSTSASDRDSIARYLIENRYPGAEVIS